MTPALLQGLLQERCAAPGNDSFKRPPFLSPVFAYGATGAGKTYTMLGSEQSPGIMYLTMVELYKRIEARKDEKSCEVLVSYQEVRRARAASPPASGAPLLPVGAGADPRGPHQVPPVPRELRPSWNQAHLGELGLLVPPCLSPIWSPGSFSCSLTRCGACGLHSNLLLPAQRAAGERWHGDLQAKPWRAVLCI